jgi:hypothetical protein
VRLRDLARRVPHALNGEAQRYGLANFNTSRRPEFEMILRSVEERFDSLPDGLARYLAALRRARVLTSEQLISQLAMLVVSFESQATTAASLIAMLLECDLYC